MSLMRCLVVVTCVLAFWNPYSYAKDKKSFGFLAFGDAGLGNQNQKEMALVMRDFCKTSTCDFVALLGDNVYPTGVQSVSDPQWETKVEAPYRELEFPFFPVFGNHDYLGNIQAQIDYSENHPKWKFSDRFYQVEKDDTALFFIDTENFDEEQIKWLGEKISLSQAEWNIVCGHRPIFSHGDHGDNLILKEKLLPLLKGRVDLYLSGHDHDLEYIDKDFRPHFVISGAAADSRPVHPGESTLYASSELGFTHVLVGKDEITVQFVSKEEKKVFKNKIKKK